MELITERCLKEFETMSALRKLKDYTPASVRKMDKRRLLDYHRKTHMIYNSALSRNPRNEIFLNQIKDLHDMYAMEILRRGMNHTSWINNNK